MSKYKIIIALILVIVIGGTFFWLYGQKKNLEITVEKQQNVIVQLEGKIVDQETELSIMQTDIDAKQQAISALEEKTKQSSLASQQTIDNLLELYSISVPDIDPSTTNISVVDVPTLIQKKEDTNSAAGKKEEKTTSEVVNDQTSKNFINLRNNIYRRYQ